MSGKLDKKVAFVLAFRDFKDDEYFIPRQILESAGAGIVNISDKVGMAIGTDGGEANIRFTLKEMKNRGLLGIDAIFFVGGPGAISRLDNDISYSIARLALSRGMILGAICISPIILAKAGVLQGKRLLFGQVKPIKLQLMFYKKMEPFLKTSQ